MPLNSLATVIRPSGCAHMHPYTSTHGPATSENTSILSPFFPAAYTNWCVSGPSVAVKSPFNCSRQMQLHVPQTDEIKHRPSILHRDVFIFLSDALRICWFVS